MVCEGPFTETDSMTSGYSVPCTRKSTAPISVRFFLEDADEFGADELPLLFRIGDAGQHVQKPIGRIDAANIQMQIVLKHRQHFLEFVLPQQTVVDEHADQPVADRARHQRRGHRRIHAAADGAKRAAVADLLVECARWRFR